MHTDAVGLTWKGLTKLWEEKRWSSLGLPEEGLCPGPQRISKS